MKRVITILAMAALLLSMAACSSGNGNDTPTSGGNDTPTTQSETSTPEKTPEPTPEEIPEPEETPLPTPEELDKLLAEQPLVVTNTNYLVQDEQYKALYPDLLQATLQNNSTEDIKNVTIAFVAWDNSGLPVLIIPAKSTNSRNYIVNVDYDAINLTPGNTWGDDYGFPVDESCNISTFKAIVVSYDTFNGDTWENPYYNTFSELYKEKKVE